MSFFVLIALFLVGLAVGSYSNVLTMRYRPGGRLFGNTVAGRSHCPHCKRTLRWFELIPLISFILQRTRCRTCHAKLSWQYPLVELCSGIFFTTFPLLAADFFTIRFYDVAHFLAPLWFYIFILLWVCVLSIWLAMVVIDIKHFLIPDEFNIIVGILGVGVIATLMLAGETISRFNMSFLGHYAPIFWQSSSIIVSYIVGAFAGALVFLLIFVLSRGRAMGFGDVKLGFASGLVLGWPAVIVAVAFSFIIGGFYGAVLLLAKKKRGSDKLPFAPFFVLGALLVVFFGEIIMRGYFGIFGA